MPAEAIRINRRVLLQCSIGAPGLKQPFAQPQQNGALSASFRSMRVAANGTQLRPAFVDYAAKLSREPISTDASRCRDGGLRYYADLITSKVFRQNSVQTNSARFSAWGAPKRSR